MKQAFIFFSCVFCVCRRAKIKNGKINNCDIASTRNQRESNKTTEPNWNYVKKWCEIIDKCCSSSSLFIRWQQMQVNFELRSECAPLPFSHFPKFPVSILHFNFCFGVFITKNRNFSHLRWCWWLLCCIFHIHFHFPSLIFLSFSHVFFYRRKYHHISDKQYIKRWK